jgi:hypothetical protein
MMVRTATSLGLVTGGTVIVIIALGLSGASPRAFHVAVELLPWMVVASSVSLGTLLWRRGSRLIAAGLLANLAMVLAAIFVRHGLDVPLNQTMLWCADVWFLVIHAIALRMLRWCPPAVVARVS